MVVGRIQREPIEVEPFLKSYDMGVGSIITFQGIVRKTESSRELEYLFYEAEEKLATEELTRLLTEAKEKFNLIDALAVHRIGIVNPGEISLLVVVNSGHRNEGFKACSFIVDAIKERLPIWKKDHFVDGEETWH